MPSSTLLTRAAAAGIATVVTATLLGAAPVQAGTGSTTYACGPGALPLPVETTIPDLPPVAPGAPVPAGSLDPAFVFDAASLASVLGLATSPSASGMALGLDGAAVPLSGFSFGQPDGAASATSGAFSAPETPGEYPITMPTSFHLVGDLGLTSLDVLCTSAVPTEIGTLTVLGEEPGVSQSTTEATLAKKRILKGKRAKVTATVTLAPIPAPGVGDVVVKKRKKTIGTGTLESGSVTIRTKAFKKPGRYTLKVKYLGEPPLVSRSKDTVVLRVKRRR